MKLPMTIGKQMKILKDTRMKRNLAILCLIAATALSALQVAQKDSIPAADLLEAANFCGMKNTAFSDGESLTIKVYYSALGIYVQAGTLTLTTNQTTLNGKPVYHAKAYGRTLSSYDWIFKVRDSYETYMTTTDLQSQKFVRSVQEGKYTSNENYTFNNTANTVTSSNKTIKVPDCTLDVVAAVYNARNIDYAKYSAGQKIPFTIVIDEKVHNLYIRYAGKETVSTKFGKFKAIKVKPLLVKGNTFSGGEKMTIWFSDDGNRVPLRIESALSVGSVKADLMGYSNLRYKDLNSRVN
ncbi:DUF3108 domain-containing protein [Haoranjiania flava]|uniref:DUF3108 domain-containing protein n=1 Tax=Haoranjiania flava TaxID=1856322 RepID=A0AAE3IJZ3_9BACT|nr:DUF3108 domain-containing protein [Haoranjiania flava]MCU7693502.1 DUF3108 domain-containing protein [Haoranjiania flava]